MLVLYVAAFAGLLAWFWVAGRGRPARLRGPMLAGLLLATLAAGLLLLPGPAEPPSAADPAPRTLWLFFRESLPGLLRVAALACYLRAFLGLPGAAGPRRPWPRALPLAAGVAWGIDLAVSLQWLGSVEPTDPAEALPVWYGVLGSALHATALGLALALLLVVLERRPAMARRAAGAALAGAILLVLARSVGFQLGADLLPLVLPPVLADAVVASPAALVWFAGTALLAVAAAEPTPAQPPAAESGSPGPGVATAGSREPTAR